MESAIEMLKEKIEESKRTNEEMERLFEQAFRGTVHEPLWDARDVAKYLKCGVSTVQQAYLSGKIPYRKVLGVIRFDPNVIRGLDNKSS